MKISEFNTIKNALQDNVELVTSQIIEAGEFFNSDSHSSCVEIEIQYNDEYHTIEGVSYGNYIEGCDDCGTWSESEVEGFDCTAVFVDSTKVELTNREKEEINNLIKSIL